MRLAHVRARTRAAVFVTAAVSTACHKVYIEPIIVPSPKPAIGRIVLVGDAGIRIGETALDLKPEIRGTPAVAGTTLYEKLAPDLAGPAAKVALAQRQVSALRQVPILGALLSDIDAHDETVTAWLGDNVYARGVPAAYSVSTYWGADGRPREGVEEDADFRSFVALHAQVLASRYGHDAVFVPGNHDWDSRIGIAEDGPKRVRAQHEAIAEFARRADGAALLQVVDVEKPGAPRTELQLRPARPAAGPSANPAFVAPEVHCDAR